MILRPMPIPRNVGGPLAVADGPQLPVALFQASEFFVVLFLEVFERVFQRDRDLEDGHRGCAFLIVILRVRTPLRVLLTRLLLVLVCSRLPIHHIVEVAAFASRRLRHPLIHLFTAHYFPGAG